MTQTSISSGAELPDEDRKAVIDGLVAYNTERGFLWDRKPFYVVARDGDRIIGGLLGEINHRWLFVSELWVDVARRGGGVGTSLIETAEREAGEQGCVGIFLDTYSFQAPHFYEALGYQPFGVLDDCPPGQRRLYLSKRLDL